MEYSVLFQPLFKVNIYHRFFLDDGETPFDIDDATTERQLKGYDISKFIKIIPSQRTQSILSGFRMQMHQLKDGFMVALKVEKIATQPDTYKPFIALDDDIQLDFLLQITNSDFEAYSEVSPINSIPYYFSNHKPYTETPESFNYINRSGDSIYASQFTISDPGFELVKEDLSRFEYKNILGIISLKMKGDNSSHNITLVNGNLPQTLPQFKVLFNNRKTFWRYFEGHNPTPIYSTEPHLKPLVARGTVAIGDGDFDYPAASPRSLSFEKDNNGNITKTFSNIYIIK